MVNFEFFFLSVPTLDLNSHLGYDSMEYKCKGVRNISHCL